MKRSLLVLPFIATVALLALSILSGCVSPMPADDEPEMDPQTVRDVVEGARSSIFISQDAY